MRERREKSLLRKEKEFLTQIPWLEFPLPLVKRGFFSSSVPAAGMLPSPIFVCGNPKWKSRIEKKDENIWFETTGFFCLRLYHACGDNFVPKIRRGECFLPFHPSKNFCFENFFVPSPLSRVRKRSGLQFCLAPNGKLNVVWQRERKLATRLQIAFLPHGK